MSCQNKNREIRRLRAKRKEGESCICKHSNKGLCKGNKTTKIQVMNHKNQIQDISLQYL